MQHYSIAHISKIINGKLSGDPNEEINKIFIDSRNNIASKGSLFFALSGPRNDGHQYILKLIKRGFYNFVVSIDIPELREYKGINIILVKDCLNALQDFAGWHRENNPIPSIGITGSNGKTILKEFLFQSLSPTKKIVRSPKSYNSQVGVPLSLLLIEKEHELGIFEAGISKPGEMKSLQRMIQANLAVITNIGQAHQENFVSLKEKAQEKIQLCKNASSIFFCYDHDIIRDVIDKQLALSKKQITWSYYNPKANLFISDISETAKGETMLKAVYSGREFELTLPFTDKASIENGIFTVLIMLSLGYSIKETALAVKKLEKIGMRLELLKGKNNCTLINDSYNSDLESIEIAINFLSQQKQHQNKLVILSDILENDKNPENIYHKLWNILNPLNFDQIIGIGSSIKKFSKNLELPIRCFNSGEELIRYFSLHPPHNTSILLKGARQFAFEKISAFLQEKEHRTILEINLNKLIDNLNHYKSLLQASTKTMVMVKAFSYGSGSYEIANVLQHQQVDYLAVAYTDEGIALRDAGIEIPIMVMNSSDTDFDSLINYNLEPEIYSLNMMRSFQEYLEKPGISGYPVHIKIDTGMHRLGIEEKDIHQLIETHISKPYLSIRSVFSHLSASDDPKEDAFTQYQTDVFKRCCNILRQEIPDDFLMHILNTSGIERFPEYQFDMIRLGIGLYGINNKSGLQEVGNLRTRISQIKKIKKGETVGYNRMEQAESDLSIATIPVGYADGLDRRLGNRKAWVSIRGKKAPYIGNICMDMSMVDISDIPDANEGDDVIVFGDQCSIYEHAKILHTIPYEIFTGISTRVKRIYIYE